MKVKTTVKFVNINSQMFLCLTSSTDNSRWWSRNPDNLLYVSQSIQPRSHSTEINVEGHKLAT